MAFCGQCLFKLLLIVTFQSTKNTHKTQIQIPFKTKLAPSLKGSRGISAVFSKPTSGAGVEDLPKFWLRHFGPAGAVPPKWMVYGL